MATDTERLVISLEASMAKLEREMRRGRQTVDKQLGGIEKRFDQSQKKIEKFGTGLSAGMARAFGRFAGPAAVGLATKEIVQLGNAVAKAENPLRAAGISGEELNKVWQTLFETAQRTGTPIAALTELYGKLSLSQKELGITGQQLTTMTESIALALQSSGTSAAEAQGAILQLSQAFGGGKVQAEEWNSILDGLPTLARAAAIGMDGVGGSVAELTRKIKAGEVSSIDLFRAIEKGSGALKQQAETVIPTLETAWTRVTNALQNAARETNIANDALRGINATAEFAAFFITNVAKGYDVARKALADFAKQMDVAERKARVFSSTGEELSTFDPSRFDFPNAPAGSMAGYRPPPAKPPAAKPGDGAARRAKDTRDETSAIRERTEAVEESIISFEDLEQVASGAMSGFISDLRQGETAADALAEALNRIVDDLLQMAASTAIKQLFAAMSRSGPLSPLGPPLAGGGPVAPGKSYLVGERGPELFTPGRRGTVTPNSALSRFGGGETEVHVHNNVPGAQATAQTAQQGGGQRVDVMVDRMVSAKAAMPGSDLNRTLQTTFGVRPGITRR